MGKIYKWNDKLATGWCKLIKGTSNKIERINPTRDNEGGYSHPYVNLPDGTTVVINAKTDKVEIEDKKIIKIIKE